MVSLPTQKCLLFHIKDSFCFTLAADKIRIAFSLGLKAFSVQPQLWLAPNSTVYKLAVLG